MQNSGTCAHVMARDDIADMWIRFAAIVARLLLGIALVRRSRGAGTP